ncbi:MAG: hypothetical protein EAZ95_08060 [Bacteroidetes bacterium]|nr:MAG: hypothetical protein EAZ95_08060 [Bacteroidota bacterium]
MKNTKLQRTLELTHKRLENYEKQLAENPDSFFHKLLVSNAKIEIEELEQEIAKNTPKEGFLV